MRFKYMCIFFFLLIVILITIACIGLETEKAINSGNLKVEEKLQDFEYMYKVIIENYPFLEVNRRVNGIDWEANYSIYKEKIISTESDNEFFDALEMILRDLNNSHTSMLNRSFVEYFRDGYYQISIEEDMQNHWCNLILDNINHKLVQNRYQLKQLNKQNTISYNGKSDVKTEPIENAEVKDIVEGKVGYIYIPKMIQNNERDRDVELIKNY
ncbi:hypothetical protein F8154_06165 [Alkaliphilus pronyensis]|uniref:Tricorn protease C1 domain-containing protein n=1 Tax=Alkaliphilus pronyensis TaxID=1482732 RepID=A0A6I0F9P9_9FIRM|nr:hypothetical protein [Alkaliphilus pronyensis]KAB3535523.1 hypothetical protein F8154_06165 [Alkaliphilus pronyensis]